MKSRKIIIDRSIGSILRIELVNDEIITEGLITVYDEEVKDSKIVEKSMKVGELIIEKGSYITIKKVKEDLKENNYGWEIQRGRVQEAFEEFIEYFGQENAYEQVVETLSDDDLKEALEFVFRMNDFNDSSYLV